MPNSPVLGSQRLESRLSADPRWAALRDRRAERGFVYAVKTTGIYCRTGCPARRPLPQNVVFYADGETARRDGYRPCKRCRPDIRITPPMLA
jgi:AraC family transcriptional regulator of adaptative response/methylated-DNA-[protein]-cysteine methyltransferase